MAKSRNPDDGVNTLLIFKTNGEKKKKKMEIRYQ